MRELVWLTACVGLVLLAACDRGKGYVRGRIRIYKGFGFSAALPSDVRANDGNPAQDTHLYDFHVGSRPLLFAYVGNAPNAPHFKWSGAVVDTELHSGLQGTCRTKQSSAGLSRECLFRLSDDFPQKLHIWYENLDDSASRVADAVVDSLEAVPP